MVKKTILVVDDDPSITAIFEFILQQSGFHCLTAESGQTCLNVIASNPHIDLVFLDIKMPGISGIDVLRELSKKDPLLKIVLMSGHAVDRLISDAYSLGAYGLILKPFDVEEVLSIVTQIFSPNTTP